MSKQNKSLLDKKKFIGYQEGDPKGCCDRCVDMLAQYGIVDKGSGGKVYKLMYESGGKLVKFGNNPSENYSRAIECIDKHLDNDRPIIVGVNHTIGRGINEGTTDHFVLIHSRRYENNCWYYEYYETGTSYTDTGCSQNNSFIYVPDGQNGPSFYNKNGYVHGRYDVTQVRPNFGKWVGLVSQDATKSYDSNTSFDLGESKFYSKVRRISDNNYQKLSTASSTKIDQVTVEGALYLPNGKVGGITTWEAANETGGGGYGSFASLTSFGVETIFGSVFPNDDNNKYINMSSEEISIIQYSEPTLTVKPLNISDKTYASMGVRPEKVAYYIPVVCINDFMIPQTDITNFCLDYSSFAPQVMVEFVDMKNNMLSTTIPKPGSLIKVFLGGYGDEKYYKPIRQDFVITNINKTNKTGGEYQNYPNSGNPIKYRFTGVLNVPLGFRKMGWSSSAINARQAMFNISNMVGLGFATNFDTNNDRDVMRWINVQNRTYYDFMRDITHHAVYSPYTFFTSFIDQYYVLNFVECHRLLSRGGNKKDLPQMIYNCIMPNMDKNKQKTTDENLNNGEQKVSYYCITNSIEFKGWTNYIEEYFEINDGYSLMSDGYSKILTYSDKCVMETEDESLPSKNYQFYLTPIDNLERDENKCIKSLPSEITKDSYIPLNLRQTSDPSYMESGEIFDNPTAAESTINIGEVDSSNVFGLYFYAYAQNDFQMKNLKKCGLSVRLQNYNPSITRFSRIWVDLYDMNKNSLTQIKKDKKVDNMPDSMMKDILKEKNENIISFEEERVKDTEHQVYNRSLSGWYVVTDMKIVYNLVKDFNGKTSRKLQTILTLNRIEYKPTYKHEYEMAKKAIEKYKGENLPNNIMTAGDILYEDTEDDSTNG